MGASLGSVIPGIGTGVGAGLGALGGGLWGLFGGGSNADAQQQQGFQQQQDLIKQLQGQANGTGPSVAQNMLGQALQQNQAATASQIGSMRGMNAGAGANMILQHQAQEGQAAAGQGATLRAQEMLANQQLLANTIGQSRGQSIPLAQQQSSQNNNMLGGLIGGAGAALGSGALNGQSADANGNTSSIGQAFGMGSGVIGAHGGAVPGGTDDSYSNDKVPALLSPEEIVLPRSIANAPDAPERAREFVEALRAHQARGKRGPLERKRLAFGGGRVQQGYEAGGVVREIRSGTYDEEGEGGEPWVSPAAKPYGGQSQEDRFAAEDARNSAANRPALDAAAERQPATQGPGILAAPPPEPQPAEPTPSGQTGMLGIQDPNEMAGAGQQAIGGMKGEAKAAQGFAHEQTKVMDEWNAKRQAMTDEYQKQAAAHQAHSDAMFKDVMESGIKPGQFWEHQSTGQKLNASIGMILGGIGAGMTGGPNVAAEMINKAIDRDVEAQKINLGKKENLLSRYMQQGRDMAQSHLLATADMHDAAAAQLAKASMAYQGTRAAADAQVLIGQERQKGMALRQEATLRDYSIKEKALGLEYTQKLLEAKSMLSSGASGVHVNPEVLDKDTRERLVETPAGQRLSPTTKDAEGVREAMTKTDELQSTIKDMREFMKGGMSLPLSKRNAQAAALSARAYAQVNHIADIQRLSEKDIELLHKQIPDPGAFMQGQAGAQLDELQRLTDTNLMAHMRQHLEGQKPAMPARGRRANE